MPNAAFTMVQNDMVILELWLKYYSKYFEDLYVIGNGTKEEYKDLQFLKDKYPFQFDRLDSFAGNSDLTVAIVKEKQVELLKTHGWVLYSDCDEYIVADPKLYKDLKVFMEAYPQDKVYCEGFNVLQAEDETPIDFSKPYLTQRKYWSKDNDYNKPLLARVPLNWAQGCHREHDIADVDGKKFANTGLFLLHLKYADLQPMGNRDFGPTRTNVQYGKIDEGMNIKEEIPEEIRRLF